MSHLVQLPEGEDLGGAVDTAMRLIETDNPELKDVLPKGYQRLEKSTLVELLRLFAPLPRKLSGDAFGLIYEDFLSNFAMAEGRLGGEFFTPHSIVRLIVEIIEPFHGRVFDPACGSGGMFVQCAKFVERHQHSATDELAVYGQEQKEVTVPLAKMNLALHGLSGDIRLGNSYYDDLHHSLGAFDFVMANPPFNVDGVDKDKLAGDPRYPFGLPKPDNGNYLWIQLFYSALAEGGRAGFVMANSAGDAGHSEREIRRKLIESKAVDVMVAIGTNFFYTVTLPVTLWFLDKGKWAPTVRTRCSSSMLATPTARSTVPIVTSCLSRSSCWPTSCGSTGARTWRRSLEARRRSRSGSLTAPTSMCLACARW